eukprot:scaffold249019_cov27-Tisochrysis_lutea.AAC.1
MEPRRRSSCCLDGASSVMLGARATPSCSSSRSRASERPSISPPRSWCPPSRRAGEQDETRETRERDLNSKCFKVHVMNETLEWY